MKILGDVLSTFDRISYMSLGALKDGPESDEYGTGGGHVIFHVSDRSGCNAVVNLICVPAVGHFLVFRDGWS